MSSMKAIRMITVHMDDQYVKTLTLYTCETAFIFQARKVLKDAENDIEKGTLDISK